MSESADNIVLNCDMTIEEAIKNSDVDKLSAKLYDFFNGNKQKQAEIREMPMGEDALNRMKKLYEVHILSQEYKAIIQEYSKKNIITKNPLGENVVVVRKRDPKNPRIPKLEVSIPSTYEAFLEQCEDTSGNVEKVLDGPSLEHFYGTSDPNKELFKEILALRKK